MSDSYFIKMDTCLNKELIFYSFLNFLYSLTVTKSGQAIKSLQNQFYPRPVDKQLLLKKTFLLPLESNNTVHEHIMLFLTLLPINGRTERVNAKDDA